MVQVGQGRGSLKTFQASHVSDPIPDLSEFERPELVNGPENRFFDPSGESIKYWADAHTEEHKLPSGKVVHRLNANAIKQLHSANQKIRDDVFIHSTGCGPEIFGQILASSTFTQEAHERAFVHAASHDFFPDPNLSKDPVEGQPLSILAHDPKHPISQATLNEALIGAAASWRSAAPAAFLLKNYSFDQQTLNKALISAVSRPDVTHDEFTAPNGVRMGLGNRDVQIETTKLLLKDHKFPAPVLQQALDIAASNCDYSGTKSLIEAGAKVNKPLIAKISSAFTYVAHQKVDIGKIEDTITYKDSKQTRDILIAAEKRQAHPPTHHI